MRPAELYKVRHSCHGPILFENLAKHGERAQSRQTSKVDRCFGMTLPLEDASIATTQRENVSRPCKVFRTVARIDGGANRSCTIVSGDAGRHTESLCINRNGKGCTSQRSVV